MRSYPVLFTLLFSYSTFASHQFGYTGYHGNNGHQGQDGGKGPNAMIVAGPSVRTHYNLNGSQGLEGFTGQRGSDARSCIQPHEPPHDLHGANGGTGGSGGLGGNGGDGGDATFHYSDITALRNVTLVSHGGAPGSGARGNAGGNPCYCHHYSWKAMVNGQPKSFQCSPGHIGASGFDSLSGKHGGYGALRLINQLEPLAPVNPTHSLNMEEILDGPFDLSDNRWSKRVGARALFSPQSDTRDDYDHFDGRIDRQYGFRWEATRPLADFAGKGLKMILQANNRVRLNVPSNVWHLGTEIGKSPQLTTYVFEGAIHENEAMNIHFQSVTGSYRDLKAVIQDDSGFSNDIQTSFRLTYRTKAFLLYRVRFSGEVDPKYVTKSGNEFTLHLGEMPINSKWLQSGMKSRIQITARRSYGSGNGNRGLSQDYYIP